MFLLLIILFLISSCQTAALLLENPVAEKIDQIPPGMSEAEGATLSSLEQIDPFPLYTMIYEVDYSQAGAYDWIGEENALSWACSLFAVMGDPEDMFFGRNFDWDFSPALLLFTDPPDGYASVSMVDIAYLGYGEENAFGLTDLPLSERNGQLNPGQALNLLSEIAQESSQWSVVYGISSGEVQVVMDRQYEDIHNLTLE